MMKDSNHNKVSRNKVSPWALALAVQGAVWLLFTGLRLLGVFDFRMKYVPLLALIFLVADGLALLILYDRKHLGEAPYLEKRRICFVLLGITIISSIPLFTDYILNGHDIQFHLFRMEGVKDGLMDGQFPVMIHPNTLHGYGYANPVFYPELLLYFPAALRLCGFSIMGAYKTFLFALNGLTAFVAYVCFTKMFGSKKTGVMGSALYTLSLYRLIILYTRAAIGEASAMTFLPLIVYGLYRILAQDDRAPGYKTAFLPLALGMTGLVATHLLSCEMALPLLALVCLVFIKRTFQKRRLLSILTAAGVTILLSACFIVPMLDFMGHDTYQVFLYSVSNRAHEALNVAQLFPLLPNGVGESNPLSMGIQGEMPMGVGFVFALVLVAYPVLRARAKAAATQQSTTALARTELTCYLLAALLLFMSTNLFPWTGLYNLGGLFAYAASLLQFPWRLLAPATVLLCVAACGCLRLLPMAFSAPEAATPETPESPIAAHQSWTRLGYWPQMCLYTLCLFMLLTPLAYFDRVLQESPALHINLFTDLDQSRSVGDAEYLPYGSSGMETYLVDSPINATDGLAVDSFSREGTHIRLALNNQAAQPGHVDLPLIYYLGYGAKDNEGTAFSLTKGDSSRIQLQVPAGYSGEVEISFQQRPLWRTAQLLSLLTACGLVWVYVRQRKKAVVAI